MCYTGLTTKNEVAIEFSRDTKLITNVKNYIGYKNYVDDMVQDIMLQILTIKDEERLLDACHKDRFNVWLFSILKNQKTNPRSYTNRYYVNNLSFEPTNQENNGQHNINEYTYKIEQEHKAYLVEILKEELIKIKKNNWYQTLIFTEYADMKAKYEEEGKKLTFEQFGKEMKINKNSLFKVIKKVKIRLKERIKNEL